MKCPNCGMEVRDNERTCPYCYGVLQCGDQDNCGDETGRKSKKKVTLAAIIIVVAAVIILAVAAFILTTGKLSGGEPDDTAAEFGQFKLTNAELNYYYYSDYYYYLSYGDVYKRQEPAWGAR